MQPSHQTNIVICRGTARHLHLISIPLLNYHMKSRDLNYRYHSIIGMVSWRPTTVGRLKRVLAVHFYSI